MKAIRSEDQRPNGCRVDRNQTESGGKAPQPGFLLDGELAQVSHDPATRASPGGYLHRTGSFGIRSGGHAHAPGSSSASCFCNREGRHSKLTHMYLIHSSVGAPALFFPSAGGFTKTHKKKHTHIAKSLQYRRSRSQNWMLTGNESQRGS